MEINSKAEQFGCCILFFKGVVKTHATVNLHSVDDEEEEEEEEEDEEEEEE